MAIDAVSGAAVRTNAQVAQIEAPKKVEHVVKQEQTPKQMNKPNQETGTFKDAKGAVTLENNGEMTQEKMHKALEDINKKLSSTSCEYGYDDRTNRVTIKILDKETDEVIRELPPEKTLEMIAKAWELAGILVDEKL